MLLITEPIGARLPRGNVTVLVRPCSRARLELMITSSGSTPSCSSKRRAAAFAASLVSHHWSTRSSGSPVTVRTERSSRFRPAQVEHDFGHSSGEDRRDGRVIIRAVGQDADKPGNLDVDVVPILDRGSVQAGGEGDGRMWSSKLVEPPNAACTTMAFLMAESVSTSARVKPCAAQCD